MEVDHQVLNKPIYGVVRNLKITQSREEDEPTNQKRDLSCCYYLLRENPKKKTQKSPEKSMKKILFRCQECGKGFRYEKCLSNHQAGMHFSRNQKVTEEALKSLCSSFSLVKKKKRSRVIRYKKTQFSCSFTTFRESSSGFFMNDDEFEVAQCLILLSKSSPKFVDGLKLVAEAVVDANPETPKGCYESGCLRNKKLRKRGEFQSWFFSNGHKLMEESVGSYETASFLRDENNFDQLKRRNADGFESAFLSDEQKLLKEENTTHEAFKEPVSFLGHKCELDQQKLRKAGEFGIEQTLMEETWKEPASFLRERNDLDQQKLRKVSDFESGFYRTELGVEAMECTDIDIGVNTESDKKNIEHQCRLCNKVFSSYQALGGHQTFHRMSKSKNKMNCREELVEEHEVEPMTATKETKTHKCSICSRKFRSVHALGGHKKYHGKRQHSKTEDDENLGFLSVGIKRY